MIGYFKEAQPLDRMSYFSNSKLQNVIDDPGEFYARYGMGIFPEQSPAQYLGKMAHLAILEPDVFEKTVVVMDFGDQRSPKNREAKAIWLENNQGVEVVATELMERLKAIRAGVLRNKFARYLVENSFAERHGYCIDKKTGRVLYSRPDLNTIYENRSWIIDLKTTTEITTRSILMFIEKHRVDLQAAFYQMVDEEIHPGRARGSAIMFVQTKPPYNCRVIPFTERYIKKGTIDVRTAIDKLHSLLEIDPMVKNPDVWTLDPIEEIDVPYWALAKNPAYSEIIELGE